MRALVSQRSVSFLLWMLSSACAGTNGCANSPGTTTGSGGVGTGGSPAVASGGTTVSGGAGGAVSTGGTTAAPSGGSGGTASSTGGAPPATGGSAPLTECPAVQSLGVRVVGRYACGQGIVSQAWSGTGFVAHFEGSGLALLQTGPSVEYTLVLDGALQNKLVLPGGTSPRQVLTDLTPGEHTVELYRRGEASFGATSLVSVLVQSGSLLPAPPAQARSIEVVGDSISCGYGNEGADTSCGFSADTENHYLTYGAVLARHFDAELSTIAWSGKGVVKNYDGGAGPTLPELYERALPENESDVWDFSAARPADLVLINLGTNDYSTDPDPTDASFTAGYVALLEKIRARYPQAIILGTVGPMLSGTDLDKARGAIAAAVAARTSAGDSRVHAHELTTGNPSPGCDWHPTVATHAAMAAELQPVVAGLLGW